MATKSELIQGFLLMITGILFCILAPHFLSQYGQHIAIVSLFFILMTSAWNLIAGFTGQVSFAQAAFASVGAYSSGLLMLHTSLPVFVCIPAAMIIAAALGWLLGKICIPFGGKYLSLVTLSFSEILRIILTNEDQWTRGTQGLQLPGFFAEYSKAHALWIFTGAVLIILLALKRLISSNQGLLFRSVMNDEQEH